MWAGAPRKIKISVVIHKHSTRSAMMLDGRCRCCRKMKLLSTMELKAFGGGYTKGNKGKARATRRIVYGGSNSECLRRHRYGRMAARRPRTKRRDLVKWHGDECLRRCWQGGCGGDEEQSSGARRHGDGRDRRRVPYTIRHLRQRIRSRTEKHTVMLGSE